MKGDRPAAIRSALTNNGHSASRGRNSRAKVVFPAPFGPAMMKQTGFFRFISASYHRQIRFRDPPLAGHAFVNQGFTVLLQKLALSISDFQQVHSNLQIKVLNVKKLSYLLLFLYRMQNDIRKSGGKQGEPGLCRAKREHGNRACHPITCYPAPNFFGSEKRVEKSLYCLGEGNKAKNLCGRSCPGG